MRLLFTPAIGAIAFFVLAGQSAAQVNVFFQPDTSGDYYNESTSWLEPNLEQMFVPSFQFDEIAIIDSGGVATVSNDGSSISGYDPSPGRLVLGSNSVSSGTLEVQSGGVLRVKANTSTGLSAGNLNVGTNGIGVLNVLPGGLLSTEGPLTMGANPANTILVGDATGAGSATLSPNSAVLGAATRVYSNAAFSSATTLNFTGSSVYTVEVNGFGNGLVGAAGELTLGGTLNLSFSGVSPAVGDSWTVAEGSTVSGSFDSITTPGQLPLGQSFVQSTAAGGPGEQVVVSLEEVLVLEVNRNSGAATITQPGLNSLPLDGYFVGSDSVGSLDPSGWSSFASQGGLGSGWIATANDANTIGELKSSGSTSISSGGSVELGSIYDPLAGDFGTIGEDLEFVYTRPTDGAVVSGIVRYSGTTVNSLVLQVDPTTGESYLRNTSQTTVDIDEYTVRSESESLSESGWSSLDSQDFEGAGTWLELLNADAGLLGELNAPGATTLAPGAAISLGNAYVGDGAGARDLDFRFLLFGDEDPTQGMVIYEPFVPGSSLGDFNGDGHVDAADYTLWRDNLGDPDESAINNNGDGGGITAADYSVWRTAYGASYGVGEGGLAAGAVPEPGSCCVVLLLSAAAVAGVRGQRAGVGESA